ncbi:sensor histidine kinase [Mangrovibacterium diazotrophicum]|uniref:histidine kinase n=1 Tax=Mangrovibacterium diazotrophicum TaxID=1261403 RepID=A0A419WBG4_9BACT|nr:HAMP domain-containing sensor histidine kinase [Mangrovibacterium diazotrophicum]RKD92820.1 two-component system phosphate regulon sensor histidine kinase PhoR [Mangrovibacterium diazotrophicum]
MNRKTFSYIVILMGLSIVGIILVQIIWINNAIGVKNDLFDRSVNEAMGQAAQRLEDRRNFRIFTRLGDRDSVIWVENNTPPPPRRMDMFRGKKYPGDIQFEFHTDSAGVQRHSYSFKGDSGQHFQSETVVITRDDSTIVNVQKVIAENERKLDSLNMALDSLEFTSPGFQKRVERKTQDLKNFTHRVITEMTDVEHERIPIPEIAEVVRRELSDKDIPIDFDLAVAEHDTIRGLSANADSLALVNTSYVVRLFPRSIFDRDTELRLYFPQQGTFIYQSVTWLLAASLIFSLIILLTFSLSIWFMLRQKKISEMKTDFINNMTHEFKTPIATISVAADSILNEKVIRQPDRVQYYVDMIKKENIRMNRQVEDILTIARLDKKEFDFQWQAVDLHLLIEDVCESIRLQVNKRGGELKVKLDAMNPIVTSDPVHCSNLIYNLLDNANKYSPDHPEIEISTKNTATGVLVSVSDKGIGMTKAVQAKIFERFYRQTSGNIHNVKGFGLGLSYARAVVEANKGSIQVHSEPGKGSRFEVLLPFALDV